MKTRTNPSDIRVADLSLLTLLGIPAAIGILCAIKPVFIAQWVVASALLCAMYLFWLGRGKDNRADRWKVLRFGLKMLGQALSQVTAFALMIAAALALFGTLGSRFDPGDPLWNVISIPNVLLVAAAMAKMTAILAICIAWARLHFFRKSGVPVASVADASFTHRVLPFPAAPAAVVESLLRHVDRLEQSTGPRYKRMLAEYPLRLATQEADGRTTFTLSWNYAPVIVKLVPLAAADGATELLVNFELRGGVHKLELFPNPIDVQLLMNFLHTQIFQRMSSELALSNAVTKQNVLRAQAVESQLRILQAQIEPHFLFNTLANVRHLYRSSTDAGEEMMDHLIVYLRSTLEELRSDASTVGKEMDLILHYLAIMKIRMGERLSYGFIIPDALAQHDFPPAMLISLVENSIKHGLHDRPTGKLTISCERDGAHLRVTVADNGAGFSSVEGTGVGLSNIRQRLEAMHGSRAWLEVGALAEGGFISSVMVPYEGNA